MQTRRFNFRISTAGFVLASCLLALPAISQEVFTWVDEEGVTHFGHAATAAKHALPENAQDTSDTHPVTSATIPVVSVKVVENDEPNDHIQTDEVIANLQ